jgi:hypothetical protein
MKSKYLFVIVSLIFALASCSVESLSTSIVESSTGELSSVVENASSPSPASSVAPSSDTPSSISQSTSSGPLTSMDRINLDLASISYTLGSVLPKRGDRKSVV